MISVVVLQNSMDLLNSEPVSPNESCVTSALDGNELIGIEAGRLSDISEVADQETTIIPAIKAEPNISSIPVVSVIYIFISSIHNCLPPHHCVLVKQEVESGKLILSIF